MGFAGGADMKNILVWFVSVILVVFIATNIAARFFHYNYGVYSKDRDREDILNCMWEEGCYLVFDFIRNDWVPNDRCKLICLDKK